MTRAPILFRVDGTRSQGRESLWRCLAYAAALQRRRRPAHFLSNLEPPELAFPLKRIGNDWIVAREPAGVEADLAQTLQEIRRVNPAAVVLDVPSVGEGYVRAIEQTGVTVVSVDHLAHIAFPSKLVINPLLGPGRDSYEVERGGQLLLGQRYAIVRPEIRRVRPLRSQEPAQPFRALVALGDDDPNNQTGELGKFLLNCPRVQRVDMAVRFHHAEIDSYREMVEGTAGQLELAVEPNEVTSRIARCHFAVTAGNSWSLELACVGIPQLVIVQNEAHWPTAHRLEEEGAAICLGWHETVSAATIRQAVQDLLSDPLDRQAMSRCGRKLIDGRGLDRMVTALEVVLHPSRPVIANVAA